MSSKCVLGQSKSYSKVIFCIYIWQIFYSAGKSDRHRSKTLSEKYSFLGRNFYKGKYSTSKEFSFKSTVPRDFVIYMFSTTVHTYLSHKCIYCMQFLNLKVKRFTLDFKFFRIIRSDRKTCCYLSLHGVDDKSMEYKTLFVV